MRFSAVLGLLPVLLVPLACSTAAPEAIGEKRASVTSGPCSASREDILASTSAARQNAIQRGFGWLDANVPYSQSASHEGYRTDCSGFVSMCWELGTSTDTAALYAGGTYDSDLGSWDDLLPADALVHRSGGKGHVVLFLGWEPGKAGACVLEQASTASDMQFRVRSLASLQAGGFKPIRANVLADDTGGATAVAAAAPADGTTTTDPAASDGVPPADPADPGAPDPSTPEPSTPGGGACAGFAAVDVCNKAMLTRGIHCGIVQDDCGVAVSCAGVPSFGCKKDETCSAAQTCVKDATKAPPTTPPTTPAKTPDTADEPAPSTGALAPAGSDPGDDTTAAATPAGEAARSPSSKAASLPSGEQAPSSGCSASPSKRAGGAGGDALPFVALAIAASLFRRRSRR